MTGTMQAESDEDSEQATATETEETTYLCAQLWTPTSRWLALSEEERYEFLDDIASEVTDMTENGIEILGFAINDADTPGGDDYRYLAMWKLPDKDHLQRLEKITATADWSEYFDAITVRGELVDPCYARLDMIKR